MSVQDGQNVNAAVTNAALMSRLNNTSTIGRIDVNNPTDSTLPSNGAFHTTGGAGIEKSVSVGENLAVTGNAQVTGTLDVTGATTVGTIDATTVIASGLVQGEDLTATDVITGNVLDVTTTANVGTDLTVAGLTQTQTLDSNGLANLNSANIETTLDVVGNTQLSTLSTSGLATLNSAQVTNNLVVQGDLTVQGTTTTVNSTVVDIADQNITLNNTGNDAASEGAGITIDRTGTSGSLIYKDASASKFAAGPLGSEIDLVNVSGTQTLTNKTIDGSSNTITNVGVGSLTGTLPIANGGTGQITSNAALNAFLPVQTGNANRVLGTDGTNTSWVVGGGGGGSGGVNLIENGDYENGIQIFTRYDDASGSRPIDGSGGSPTVNLPGYLLTNTIRGDGSFALDKQAGNFQGQGWSILTIPLDQEFRAKPLRLSMAYKIFAGTFAAGSNGSSPTDGDAIVYFYDLTNLKLVEPSNIKFFSNSSLVDTYESVVQFDSNVENVRMIVHIASTSTAAWTLILDSISLSPQLVNQGYLGTDFFSVTPPSIVGSSSGTYNPGTGSSYTCEVSIQGEEIIARYYINVGTGATEITGAYVVRFPTGYVPKTYPFMSVIGYGTISSDATANPSARLIAKTYNSDGFLLDASDSALVQPGSGLMTGSNNIVSITVRYKVQGQSGSVKMSEPGDGRPLAFTEYKSTSQSIPNATHTEIIGYDAATANLTIDSHGQFNRTTGRYTVSSAGFYRVSGTLHFQLNGAGHRNVSIWKNGALFIYGQILDANSTGDGTAISVNQLVELKAGDSVSLGGYQTSGAALNTRALGAATYLTVTKDNNSQAIGAGESIAAKYRTTAGGSVANATFVFVDYATKIDDTHGLVLGAGSGNTTTASSGWRFKPKRAGRFRITVTNSFSIPPSTEYDVFHAICVNGTEDTRGTRIGAISPAGGLNFGIQSCGTVYATSDHFISVGLYQSTGASRTLETGPATNIITIESVE